PAAWRLAASGRPGVGDLLEVPRKSPRAFENAKTLYGRGLGEWTRSQPIRTAARLPIRVPLLRTNPAFTYQEIANRAAHLRRLGMADTAIARTLGVSDKTVSKAIRSLSRSTPST